MKYSSRYDQVLEGKEPNIFFSSFFWGALADLGVYLVYAAWAGLAYQRKAIILLVKLRQVSMA